MNGWPNITVRVGVDGPALPFRALPLPSERAELIVWYSAAINEAIGVSTAVAATDEAPARVPTGADYQRSAMLAEGALGWLLGRLWAGEPLDALERWRAKDPAFNGPDGKYLAGVAMLSEFCAVTGAHYELAAAIASALIAKTQEKREPSASEVAEVTAFFGSPPVSTT